MSLEHVNALGWEIPDDVKWKIASYGQHPLVSILQDNSKFKLSKLKLESKHGDPFDRGCVDTYFNRQGKPNRIVNHLNHNQTFVEELTENKNIILDKL